ncbi:hypothetical protein VaNZ11_002449 [Volvox africanus]|uniref:J domain-containing protein n=1 Tax=Volvox africanus TaxID=51714 RepID=A0ABQ5RRX0_9CHLO|nr:hypothetical protein VaNZ11_002449 [Volvox africanus]
MAVSLVCFTTAKAEELSRSDGALHALAARAFSLARAVSLPDITPFRTNLEAIRNAIGEDLVATMSPGGNYPAKVADYRTEANQSSMTVLDHGNQYQMNETLLVRSCKRTKLDVSLQAPLLYDQSQPAAFVQSKDLSLSKMSIDNLFRLIPQLDPVVTLSSASQCVSLGIVAPATCGPPASVADPAQANRQASLKRVQGLCAVNLSNGSWRAMLRTDAPPAAGKPFRPEPAASAVLLDSILPSSQAAESDKVRTSSILAQRHHHDERKRERDCQRLDLQKFSQRGWTTWQTEQLQGHWSCGPKSQQHCHHHRQHHHRQHHHHQHHHRQHHHHNNHKEHHILQERKGTPMYINQTQLGMPLLKADTVGPLHPAGKWRYSGKRQRLQESGPPAVPVSDQWRATCSKRAAWDQPGQWCPSEEATKQQRKQQQQLDQQRTIPQGEAVAQQHQWRNGMLHQMAQGLDAPTSGVAPIRTTEPTAAGEERVEHDWPLPRESTSLGSSKDKRHGSDDMGAEDVVAPADMGAPEGASAALAAAAAGEGANFAAAPEASADPGKAQLPAFAVSMADGYGWQQQQKAQEQQQQQQQRQESGARQHSLPPPPPPLPPPLPPQEEKTAAQASRNLDFAPDDCCRDHEAVCVKAPQGPVFDGPPPAATPHGTGCGGIPEAAAMATEEQACKDSPEDVEPGQKQVHKQKDKQRDKRTGKRKGRGKGKAVAEVVAGDAVGLVGAADVAAAAELVGNAATPCGQKALKARVKDHVRTPSCPAPTHETLVVPVDKQSRRRARKQQPCPHSSSPLTSKRMAAAQRVDSPTAKPAYGTSVETARPVEHKNPCKASAAPAAVKASPMMADAMGEMLSHSGPSHGGVNADGVRDPQGADEPNAEDGAPLTNSCVSNFGIKMAAPATAAPGATATGTTGAMEHVGPQQEPAAGPSRLQRRGPELQACFAAPIPPSVVRTQLAGRAAPSLAHRSVPGATAAPLEAKPERRYKPVAPARRPRAAACNLPSTHAELAAVAAALLAAQLAKGFSEGRDGNAAHGTAADVAIPAANAKSGPVTVAEETVAEKVTMADAGRQVGDTAVAPPSVPQEENWPTGAGAVPPPCPDTAAMPPNTSHGCGGVAADLPSRASSTFEGVSTVYSNTFDRDMPHGFRDGEGSTAEQHRAGTCSAVTDSWNSHQDTGTAAVTAAAGAAMASRGPEHRGGGSDIGGSPSQRRPLSGTATSPVWQAVSEVCLAVKPSEGTAAAAVGTADAGIAAEPGFKSGLWRARSAHGLGEDGEWDISRRNSCACESRGGMVPDGDVGDVFGNNEGVGSHGESDGRPEGPTGNGGNGAGQGQDEDDAGMSEVEKEEWRRRRAEIERQRAEAAAEREAARRARAARAVASATEELERRIRQRLADHHQLASAAAAEAAAKEDIRSRIRDILQERFRKALEEHNLSRMLRQLGLLSKGTYLRTAEQRSKALKSAKIRFHPDKVTGSLEDRVYAEEVSKLLNSWTWTK